MTTYAARALIAGQADRLKNLLTTLAASNPPYALLDFPNHSNVGDSAIWLGEIAVLRQVTGAHPAHVCTCDGFDMDQFRCYAPSGPIYMSGGGNFGDIWPRHHEFRLRMLRECRDRRIIQFPQSIAFRDPANIAETARIIAGHPDFHLLVRDKVSEAIARAHFDCPVHLVPDAAFLLGSLPRPAAASDDALLLLRTDDERAGYDRTAFAGVPGKYIVDWISEPATTATTAKRSAILQTLVTGAWSRDARRLVYFNTLATLRLNRGLLLLSRGRVVVTDRLHGHILSTLLDIPNVVLDNDYGKISAYVDAWTGSYPRLQRARDSAEAMHMCTELLHGAVAG